LLVAVGSVGIFVAPAIAEPSATYQVRPGDTLSGIAQEYGVTVDSLARANDLNNPNLIWAGQTLRVSAVSAATAASAPLSPFNLTSLIEAPYYSQFDGSVWAESNCGPTALAMALGAVGRSAHPLTLRTLANRQMGSYSPYNGTTWEALAYAARQYGATPTGLYQGRYYRQWTTNALMSELAQKHPVLLLVRYRALPDHQQSSYYGDHYIVALGYDRQGNLIYNDPAIHGDGSDRTLTPSQLANAWGRTSVGLIRSAMALH
jgi:murein DD-endopeptidase MepM/ murein hydrolase activator NlpD